MLSSSLHCVSVKYNIQKAMTSPPRRTLLWFFVTCFLRLGVLFFLSVIFIFCCLFLIDMLLYVSSLVFVIFVLGCVFELLPVRITSIKSSKHFLFSIVCLCFCGSVRCTVCNLNSCPVFVGRPTNHGSHRL